MEYNIYFKKLSKKKIKSKKCFVTVNRWIKENRIMYVLLSNNYDICTEFKSIHKLNIIYEVQNQKNTVEENGNIIIMEIKKDNINKIRNTLKKWIEAGVTKKVFVSDKGKALIEVNINTWECIISDIMFYYQHRIIFLVFAILLIGLLGVLLYRYRIVKQINDEITIGIIDGYYTVNLDNIIYNTKPKDNVDKTHGDNMIEFAKRIDNKIKIYYYDATDIDGKIDSNNIILGLEYLKKNNVKIVNISLSSKKYSSQIQSWINNNPEIKIYASYNNLANTYDYPAMYEGVIGCGKRKKIKYKEIDNVYASQELIIFPQILKTYKGNSYFSLYDAIINK